MKFEQKSVTPGVKNHYTYIFEMIFDLSENYSDRRKKTLIKKYLEGKGHKIQTMRRIYLRPHIETTLTTNERILFIEYRHGSPNNVR